MEEECEREGEEGEEGDGEELLIVSCGLWGGLWEAHEDEGPG